MPEELEAIVRSLLQKGKKVTAVKVVRNRTGWGLRAAKEFVDKLEKDDPYTRPAVSEFELTEKACSTLKRQGKIAAIKLVQQRTGWGLKQSKDFVDNLAE